MMHPAFVNEPEDGADDGNTVRYQPHNFPDDDKHNSTQY